jgi:hypothetical protein
LAAGSSSLTFPTVVVERGRIEGLALVYSVEVGEKGGVTKGLSLPDILSPRDFRNERPGRVSGPPKPL